MCFIAVRPVQWLPLLDAVYHHNKNSINLPFSFREDFHYSGHYSFHYGSLYFPKWLQQAPEKGNWLPLMFTSDIHRTGPVVTMFGPASLSSSNSSGCDITPADRSKSQKAQRDEKRRLVVSTTALLLLCLWVAKLLQPLFTFKHNPYTCMHTPLQCEPRSLSSVRA